MRELIFLAEPDEDGGYSARAEGAPIFTQGESWEDLEIQIRDAVLCHFDEADRPRSVRVRLAKETLIAV